MDLKIITKMEDNITYFTECRCSTSWLRSGLLHLKNDNPDDAVVW